MITIKKSEFKDDDNINSIDTRSRFLTNDKHDGKYKASWVVVLHICVLEVIGGLAKIVDAADAPMGGMGGPEAKCLRMRAWSNPYNQIISNPYNNELIILPKHKKYLEDNRQIWKKYS